MNRLDMSLDDIIAQNKAEKKNSKASKKQVKKPNKPKERNVTIPRQKHHPGSNGQWTHDRFGKPDSPNTVSKRGRAQFTSRLSQNKHTELNFNGRTNSNGLLSRAAREANRKSGPITTAQLRSTNDYTLPLPKKQVKTSERAPAAPKAPAPKPAQSIVIKGSSGPATVLVSNLDPEANTSDLKAYFGQFGEVLQVSLLYDEHNRCSGNAEIKFGKKSEAQLAVQKMHNVVADDRVIIVQLKPDPTPRVTSSSIPPRSESRVPSSSERGTHSGVSRVSNSRSFASSSLPYARAGNRVERR